MIWTNERTVSGLIWTNERTVSGWIWTNERASLWCRWQQLNSLVAERHEGDQQFVSLTPPAKPQPRPKLPKHSSLAFPPREYDEEGLSDSLKLRIAGAAFGVRKKERQKIDDVFHSINPRQTMLDNHHDDMDHISVRHSDKGHQTRNKPTPSVGSLQKPNHSRPNFVYDGDRKGQLQLLHILPH